MGLELIFRRCLLTRHLINSFSHKTPRGGQRQQPGEAVSPIPAGNFYKNILGLLLFCLGRSQNHYHAATFHDGGLFDDGEVCQFLSHFLQVG